ncbi:MAG: glycosyltransferase [Lachnospiraceae bacterium]|nr:glycosyltransferase [Lachnospiraceae bacterium]
MDNIKVSVIVPLLNAEEYLKQCIDSIRIQTLSEIEIICVDAGSVDGTLDILKEYEKLDIRIHILDSDKKSYGYQMNIGIRAAKGEYIGIVEPDDYVAEDMFERLYNAAYTYDLDFVKSDYYLFMDYEGRRHYRKYIRKVEENYNKLLVPKGNLSVLVYGDHGNIWSGIYKRKFLLEKHISFHESGGASYQDTGFAILCSLEAERVMFLDDFFYRYRQGHGGASVSSQEKHSHIITEYQWIWQQMQERGFIDEISRSFFMAMKIHSYLWNYRRLYPDGRRHFLENLKKEEIFSFDEETVGHYIPGKDRMIALWKGDWSDLPIQNEIDRIKRANAKELLEVFRNATRIVVVSAGDWGSSLLKLDKKLGTGRICAVCDNSLLRQGEFIEDMKVISVEEAVHEYAKAFFIIANKKHAQELAVQLEELGIMKTNIYIYKERISIENGLFNFLLLDDR